MNICMLNKYKYIQDIYNSQSHANIIEDFVNNHENSILPTIDLIKLAKKQITLYDLLLNENIHIQNILTKEKTQYILDHRLYLFINVKEFDTPFVIREMKLNTEFLIMKGNIRSDEIERNFYEDFLSEIDKIRKIAQKREGKESKSLLINSVFFAIRYQKANSNKFFDSLFILNSRYFNLKNNGFEVRELFTPQISNLRNFFLSLFVETAIKENKSRGAQQNIEKIIKDTTENYNKFIAEFRLILRENSLSSLIKPENKECLALFQKNSNKLNTFEFINNSKGYLDELNIEIERIKKKIQTKEKEFGFKAFVKKTGFFKNTLFVILIVFSFVLLFVLMFN